MISNESVTNLTAWGRVMKNRVIRRSVIGSDWPASAQLAEERDHRAAAAHDVAVADHGEAGRVGRGVVVAGDEELVGGELGRAVEVDRGGRLVGGQRDDPLDAGVDAGLDDVLRADDVRLHELPRVVLGGVDLLERGCVDDVVDAVHGPVEAVAVADVADEPAQPRVVAEQLAALVLLELVAAEDHDPLGVVVLQGLGDERLAERAGATGDEDRGAGENGRGCSGDVRHGRNNGTSPHPR